MNARTEKESAYNLYNYGFVSGTASYCRLVKKWVSDLEYCPNEANPDSPIRVNRREGI